MRRGTGVLARPRWSPEGEHLRDGTLPDGLERLAAVREAHLDHCRQEPVPGQAIRPDDERGERLPILSNLAILRVNFDQQGKDFIDNFIPFVVPRSVS